MRSTTLGLIALAGGKPTRRYLGAFEVISPVRKHFVVVERSA